MFSCTSALRIGSFETASITVPARMNFSVGVGLAGVVEFETETLSAGCAKTVGVTAQEKATMSRTHTRRWSRRRISGRLPVGWLGIEGIAGSCPVRHYRHQLRLGSCDGVT